MRIGGKYLLCCLGSTDPKGKWSVSFSVKSWKCPQPCTCQRLEKSEALKPKVSLVLHSQMLEMPRRESGFLLFFSLKEYPYWGCDHNCQDFNTWNKNWTDLLIIFPLPLSTKALLTLRQWDSTLSHFWGSHLLYRSSFFFLSPRLPIKKKKPLFLKFAFCGPNFTLHICKMRAWKHLAWVGFGSVLVYGTLPPSFVTDSIRCNLFLLIIEKVGSHKLKSW